MPVIPPKPESWLEKIADGLMLPVMYFLQMNIKETPQRTHFWNNTKYPNDIARHLDGVSMVSVPGDADAVRRWLGFIPIFHMPIFGGWRQFVVLEPVTLESAWYIGWVVGDAFVGVSHITLSGSVRLLQGSGTAQFFGVNDHGDQIPLRIVGYGKVGKAGVFSKVPLL